MYNHTSVKAIAITTPLEGTDIPDAEGLMAYCARVSNEANQRNWQTADRLLTFCANEGHWSVFAMVNVVLEVKTPRDISRQILRHSSFDFQEFSQRYSDNIEYCLREIRMQDPYNRQNSLPCNDPDMHAEWAEDQAEVLALVSKVKAKWKERGVAKECIRVFNPEGLVMSRMYINANVRNLFHYTRVRRGGGTQDEHVDVAVACAEQVSKLLPTTWAALEETIV